MLKQCSSIQLVAVQMKVHFQVLLLVIYHASIKKDGVSRKILAKPILSKHSADIGS